MRQAPLASLPSAAPVPATWEEFAPRASIIASRLGRPFGLSEEELIGMSWIVFQDARQKYDYRKASFQTFFNRKLAWAIRAELGLTSKRDALPENAEEIFAAPAVEPLESTRAAAFDEETERLFDAVRDFDPARFAQEQGKTPRRGQQVRAEQIRRFEENGDLFAGGWV